MKTKVAWRERFNVYTCKVCGATLTIKLGLSHLYTLKIALDELSPCCADPDIYPANINKTNSIFMDSFGDGYEVRRYVKSFTYEPKIQKVIDGIIKQTIRPLGKTPIKRGDHILFHGWKDRPYHSSWSWRLEVIVNHVDQCQMYKQGIWFHEGIFFRWKDLSITARKDGIAKLDYTNEGISMGVLFNEMYPDLPDWNVKGEGKDMEIIEWL